MFFRIFGLLIFSGAASVYARFDEIRTCATIHVGDLFKNDGLTWEENLKEKCPVFFESIDCVNDFSERETGNTIFDNFKLLQKEGISNSEEGVIVSSWEIVRDVCKPGTHLNEDYLKHAQCISTLINPFEFCRTKAFQSFEEFEKLLEDEDEEVTPSMKQCFLEVYKATCFDKLIEQKCGNAPEKIFKNLVKRAKYIRLVCDLEEADGALEILRSRGARHIPFDFKHFV